MNVYYLSTVVTVDQELSMSNRTETVEHTAKLLVYSIFSSRQVQSRCRQPENMISVNLWVNCVS